LITISLLIAVIGSLIGALIYGALFAQREDRIRGYLGTKRMAWRRKRYLKAFVGAARGHAAAIDTTVLLVIVLLIPFVFAQISLIYSSYVKNTIDNLESSITKMNDQIYGTNKMSPPESIEATVRKLSARVDTLRRTGIPIVWFLRLIWLTCNAGSIYGLIFWIPFAVMRRLFENELERFTIRIQGLASKAELAELAVAESNVTDEASLRTFVTLAAAIAARNGVPELAARFDLWGIPVKPH